jgi:hypothetical protein
LALSLLTGSQTASSFVLAADHLLGLQLSSNSAFGADLTLTKGLISALSSETSFNAELSIPDDLLLSGIMESMTLFEAEMVVIDTDATGGGMDKLRITGRHTRTGL